MVSVCGIAIIVPPVYHPWFAIWFVWNAWLHVGFYAVIETRNVRSK